MAVWKARLAGAEVKIHDVDHEPAQCHVFLSGRSIRVDLFTLAVMNPPPHDLPPRLRRALAQRRVEMLEAWEKVRIIPPGSSPGVW